MGRKRLIGVISDTHGVFDPKIPSLFKNVDHILHAGDIGNISVYQQLQKVAPVTAVRGNIDGDNSRFELDAQRTFELYGIQCFMVHALGHPYRLKPEMEKQISRIQPGLVIFGHSHQPFAERKGSILFFNPGSAGPKRFSLPRCLGLLEIEHGNVHGSIIELV
jgi:putative phosphoesterase